MAGYLINTVAQQQTVIDLSAFRKLSSVYFHYNTNTEKAKFFLESDFFSVLETRAFEEWRFQTRVNIRVFGKSGEGETGRRRLKNLAHLMRWFHGFDTTLGKNHPTRCMGETTFDSM